MCLPAKLLSEITGCERLQTERPDQECRKSPRIPFSVRTFITLVMKTGLGPPTPVRLRDISATGVGFLHAQGMAVGQQFVMAVPRKRQPAICIRCSVMCCRQMAPNTFLTGARFLGVVGVGRSTPQETGKPAEVTLA
ncbi:MAG: PilZ domain-containing protein [Bacillota bacterium]